MTVMHSRAKERAKLLTAIAGVALIVAAVVGISISPMTGMPSGGGISGQVTIQPYTEDSLADMDAKGTFCKSVLSTKVNRKLEKNGYLMLDTKKEYEKYLSEYLDIVQVEPEQVPLVDDWYAAGYKAIVFSTDAYGTGVNLVAAEQYIGDESVKIVIGPAEINPAFQFSQDISNCKQTSVIVYIQAEVLDNAESIEFLVKGES